MMDSKKSSSYKSETSISQEENLSNYAITDKSSKSSDKFGLKIKNLLSTEIYKIEMEETQK